MKTFLSDGIEIAYSDDGAGAPVLLIHGFASNAHTNWVYTQWNTTLLKAGYRVLMIDNRGHGHSEKLYDPAVYEAPMMADDAARLLDHLGLKSAAVMGYSMGARITAFLALRHADKVSRAVFGGLGINMVHGIGGAESVAKALEAPSPAAVTDKTGRLFRQFAESTGSDLRALAACIRSARQKITPEELSGLMAPVLVAVGTKDGVSGAAAPLADMLPNGQAFDIEGRDHMLAVGDKSFKAKVLAFLEETR